MVEHSRSAVPHAPAPVLRRYRFAWKTGASTARHLARLTRLEVRPLQL